MADYYVKVPESVLAKLIANGTQLVVYSSFGSLDIDSIRQALSIDDESEISIRANSELIIQILLGKKIGRSFDTCNDSTISNGCRRYFNAPLKILRLPLELLSDELLRFLPDKHNSHEFLCFNIHKLHFNKDGTHTIV